MARNEAVMDYCHIWLTIVRYTLVCWLLSEKQLHDIEKHAVNAFLPNMGLCSKASQKDRFGSRAHCGYGLTCIYNFQGINQSSLLLHHL
jgi:hypothetical protein